MAYYSQHVSLLCLCLADWGKNPQEFYKDKHSERSDDDKTMYIPSTISLRVNKSIILRVGVYINF